MILRTWSDDAFTTAVAEGLRLWLNISERGRRQIGPVQLDAAAQEKLEEDAPLTPFLAKSRLDRQRFIQKAAPGVEYQHDGTKTAVIVAATLYEILIALPWDEYETADVEAIWNNLFEARQRVADYFDQKDVARPIAELADAYWPPPDWPDLKLEDWLQRQPLTMLETPVQMRQSYPSTDLYHPFIVFRRPQENYELTQLNVYWLARGLNSTYFDNVRRNYPRWEETRIQLTLSAPYLLLCNGILRGQAWSEAIAERIQTERKSDQAKPTLIILADGVEEGTEFPGEDFYSLVLPAPHDERLEPQGSSIPERPYLAAMAQAFQAEIVDLWIDPEDPKDPDWTSFADKLGRCEVAQIDRQRTVLVPHVEIAVDRERSPVDWQAGTVQVLILPVDDQTQRLGQAEAAMRWRIEAEEGVVAGAGAALYWTGHLLDEVAYDQAQWLQQALRAPLRQILENAGVPPDEAIGQQVTEWVDGADQPWRTFFIDQDNTWIDHILIDEETKSQFEVIDHRPPIILGEAVDLGLVTPLPQVQRIIIHAPQAAWQLALLHLSQTLGSEGVTK